MNLSTIYKQLNLHNYWNNYFDLILTGSWQYGTASDTSDFDMVFLHDNNIYDDVTNVGMPKTDETQKTGTFHMELSGFSTDIEREYDIRFMSYTTFIRKLWQADINCVEYICSPYTLSSDARLKSRIRTEFFNHSLPDPFYRYRILRSLMGFMNPMNRKKSKKFVVPERVNQNNLIKIANLYHLITHRYYPLNPQKGIDLMHDKNGNQLELINATSLHNNDTGIINEVLETHNAYMNETYKEEIEKAQFPGTIEYTDILHGIYLRKELW